METLLQGMKAVGLTLLSTSPEERKDLRERSLRVRVQFALPSNRPMPELDPVALGWKTKRGTLLTVDNFHSYMDCERAVLGFDVHAELSRLGMRLVGGIGDEMDVVRCGSLIAMTFIDFCYRATTGSTKETLLEVLTPYSSKLQGRNGVVPVEPGDITEALPLKFSEDLLEVMHALNNAFLEGLLDQAIIYGPITGPVIP